MQQTPAPAETADAPQPLAAALLDAELLKIREQRDAWLGLLKAIGVWFASIVLLIAMQILVAVPYVIYLAANKRLPDMNTLATDKTLVFLTILSVIPTHLLTLLVVWLVVSERGKYPFWKRIGFEWPKSMGAIGGIGVCVLIAGVLLLVGFAVTQFWGGNKTQLDLLIESSMPSRLVTAFIAVFTAPLIEELVYRGVLYSAVERTLGTAVAIGVVSLLFAGVHVFQYVNNISVITVITILSFTLTLVRAYSGKVLPSFVIHLVFNGVQSLVIALAPFMGWNT